MIPNSSTTTLSPAESEFIDLMQHGDDFFKIELLRPAKNYYKRALELNLEKEKVRQKITECDQLLAFERKVFLILAAVAAVLVLAYFVLKTQI
ncbi:MAG: hypothetical protein NTY07_06155 [Bacteroidia bacterium]|nr:hypothetical protein [Bacteroidia bacterium]